MTVRVPRALTFALLSASAALALSALAACAGSPAGSGGSASAPAVAPKPFEYAAFTGQYRFTSEAKGSQSAMGQSRETTNTGMRLATIVAARTTPDTITLTVTIDSITASNNMGMPTLGIDKVPGSKFTAKLAPNGTFYSVTGPSESESKVAADMTDEVGRSLPRLKAILASGATWTDTIRDKVKQQTLDVTREIISQFNVVGDTTVDGEVVWKILRENALTASGSGALNGQAVTLELTGAGKSVLVVSKRGVLLGGRGEDTSNGTLMLTAMNVPVSITQNSTSQFTKVK